MNLHHQRLREFAVRLDQDGITLTDFGALIHKDRRKPLHPRVNHGLHLLGYPMSARSATILLQCSFLVKESEPEGLFAPPVRPRKGSPTAMNLRPSHGPPANAPDPLLHSMRENTWLRGVAGVMVTFHSVQTQKKRSLPGDLLLATEQRSPSYGLRQERGLTQPLSSCGTEHKMRSGEPGRVTEDQRTPLAQWDRNKPLPPSWVQSLAPLPASGPQRGHVC